MEKVITKCVSKTHGLKKRGLYLAQLRGIRFKDSKRLFDIYTIIEAKDKKDAVRKFKSGLEGHLIKDVFWFDPIRGQHSIVITTPHVEVKKDRRKRNAAVKKDRRKHL